MSTTLYPLTFRHVYTDYIWGGDWIARHYGRADAPARCAESWEISAHPDGMSVVDSGALQGASLADLCAEHGAALLGTDCPGSTFPLLVKLIDAKDRLSVQVHPNDESAAKFGGQAKTEMWYILDAEPQACLCAGLLPSVPGPRKFHDACVDKTVGKLLNIIPSERGKSLFVPGGMVHAIGAGNRILEIQQNSNTTYRVFDWNRVDASGRGRELHIRQAMEVIDWRGGRSVGLLEPIPMATANPANRRRRMLRCDFFALCATTLLAPEPVALDGRSFHALFVESGAADLFWNDGRDAISLPAGTSCLVPASLGSYTLAPCADSGADGPAATVFTATL